MRNDKAVNSPQPNKERAFTIHMLVESLCILCKNMFYSRSSFERKSVFTRLPFSVLPRDIIVEGILGIFFIVFCQAMNARPLACYFHVFAKQISFSISVICSNPPRCNPTCLSSTCLKNFQSDRRTSLEQSRRMLALSFQLHAFTKITSFR